MPHLNGADDGVGYGVQGESASQNGSGVNAINSNGGTGLYAQSTTQTVGQFPGCAGKFLGHVHLISHQLFVDDSQVLFGSFTNYRCTIGPDPDSPGAPTLAAASNTAAAIAGNSLTFDAVVGETQSDAHAGVTGRNLTTGTHGGVGVYGVGGAYAGKFEGPLLVTGTASFQADARFAGPVEVEGSLGCNAACGFRIVLVSDTHTVEGTLNVTGKGTHSIAGTLNVGVDVVLTNQDCAEDFDVDLNSNIEPGTVMVLDDCGLLQESSCPYDKKVAGVISGAGQFKPGLILGRDKERYDSDRAPVALIGKVYCKVDAQNEAIEVGDLLTTSAIRGHAMKATDPIRAFGAVIGKALKSVPTGQRDLIPILVSLQ